MKFDFHDFYNRLLNRTDFWSDIWNEFPKGGFQFKNFLLPSLVENLTKKDSKALSCTLACIFYDGADKDYTQTLLDLLEEKWHTSEEDIVEILGQIRDPKSIEILYKIALVVPDYDEMRALAKKCLNALRSINTADAREKVIQIGAMNAPIIKEFAQLQLNNW